jgi:hypothetical protein
MPDETVAQRVAEPAQHAASEHELRPMAQVRRIALIEREVREFLSQAALDVVFARMHVISEGEASAAGGKRVFVGSTMLTCDVSSLAEILREPTDEGTTRRLAALLTKEPTLERRIQAVVRREVERIAGALPKSVRGETRIRTQGTHLFVDIDVEASL